MNQQLNLFPDIPNQLVFKSNQLRLDMNQDTLIQWKHRIFNHQQDVQQQPRLIQTSLFDTTNSTGGSDSLDPFNLRLHNWQFWDSPDSGDEGTYYFIIDNAVPLLLYIGETKLTAKQRWQNHDCKDYIANYIQLHRNHKLDVAVCAAFWGNIPRDRATRQKIESELIYKWRSPFNKQCWQWWGQPFGK